MDSFGIKVSIMSEVSEVDAINYTFTLAYLHTKLFQMEKLPVSQLGELWDIQERIGVDKSERNESKALRKDIIKCYVTLLQMFQKGDDD